MDVRSNNQKFLATGSC